eukprot:gene298-387_t
MKLKSYETVFILTPVLTSEQSESAIAKFRKFLLDKGANIVHEDAIGLKKLAYPINHKNTGIYHLIEFTSDPALIADLEIAYKRDESVIRFLTFVLDKHAVEYNTMKRNGTLQLKKQLPFEPKKEMTKQNRKKYCRFKKLGINYIDYKNLDFLFRFLNEQGKILPRRISGNSLKYQKKVATAVKRARHLALLPYVADNLK